MTYLQACELDRVEPDDRTDIDDGWKERALEDGEWDATDEEYFADSAVSHSQLEVFRSWRPTYYSRFVAKTEVEEPSDALTLGSAMHCIALEPDAFVERFAVAPKVNRKTKKGKAEWLDFTAANLDKRILTQEQYQTAKGMATALKSNREFMFLLANATAIEQPYRFRQILPDGSQIQCRFKPDIIVKPFRHDGKTFNYAVDIKSARDVRPDVWLRDAFNYGYHRQAAFYIDGAKAVDGIERQFCHVVVGNTEPYPVVIYCLDHDSVNLGRLENLSDLMALAECRVFHDWRDPAEKEIQHVRLPQWAFRKGYADSGY